MKVFISIFSIICVTNFDRLGVSVGNSQLQNSQDSTKIFSSSFSESRVIAETSLFRLTDYVSLTLYTRAVENNPINITYNNWQETKKHLMFDKEFKFLIHGWRGSGQDMFPMDVKHAYLLNRDINVIIVDWSVISMNILYYIPAVTTKKIGAKLGEFLNFLIKNGVNRNLIHIIGHSLGAQIAGYAGKEVKNRKILRITGLDPAAPGFRPIYTTSHISKDDAQFVDVIHTAAPLIGILHSLGNADFYPNSGIAPQPGCIKQHPLIQLSLLCSHKRSYEYFRESINQTHKFESVNCLCWKKYGLKECMKNATVLMGDSVPLTTIGNFYLKTNPTHPYAKKIGR